MTQSPTPPQESDYRQPGGSGLAIASMVLGLVSVVIFCIWYVALPCAIIAVVLGFIARAKANRGEASGGGMAMAGIVLGFVAIGIAVLVIILAIIGISILASNPEFQQEIQEGMEEWQQEMERQAEEQEDATSSMLPATGQMLMTYARAVLSC